MEALLIAFAMILALFLIGWHVLPEGWLTNTWLAIQGGVVVVLPMLDYLAAFHWQTVMTPGQAALVGLMWNLLAIAARQRGMWKRGRP